MKALVLTADRQLIFDSQRPTPPPVGEDPVLIRVAACGVCGSDLPRAYGGKAYHYPLVMGHEFSAVVEETPAGGRFHAGDRVAVFPLLPCRRCVPCQTGDYAQCTDYDYFGSRRDGGFEELLHVPAANLYPVPEGVNLLHAACTEPAAVALHGVRKFRIQAGDTAVVFGAGPIGNMTAQWLRLHGCGEVMLVDVDERKLDVARAMGFTALDARAGDPVQAVLDRTAGAGAMRCVEACGLPATFLQAVQAAARFGEVLFLGNIAGTFTIGEKDFSNILRKELTIHGTWNSRVVPAGQDDWSTVLRFLDRGLDVGPLISDRLPLEEGPRIFADLAARRGFHNKVVFDITPEATR
jgi:L-iditol 2-dehydrogenase